MSLDIGASYVSAVPMYSGTLKHDAYLHFRAIERLSRSGRDLTIEVTFALSVVTAYPEPGAWEPIYDWLKDRKIEYFTWSPFTDEHRRYFSFAERKDAVLFKLAWFDDIQKKR